MDTFKTHLSVITCKALQYKYEQHLAKSYAMYFLKSITCIVKMYSITVIAFEKYAKVKYFNGTHVKNYHKFNPSILQIICVEIKYL